MMNDSLVQSGRSRLGKPLSVQIASTGMYVPERVVTNEDLASLGCDSDWIVQRTGIRQRRFARDDQATSDLAYLAALDCLSRVELDPSQVDLVLVATITQDYMTPSTACILQRKLGCIAPAFDLNAACSGFMYGLIVGSQFIANGLARNALVVGSEVMSRTVNPTDVKTYPLFGDGAGAALLGPSGGSGAGPGQESPGILAFTLGSEGSPEALCTPGGGSREPLTPERLAQGRQYMQMDGRTVFKWAVRCVVDSCRDVLATAGYTIDQVDLVLMHQANTRIIDAAVEDLRIDPDKVVVNLDRYGNTSAASVPLVLHEANLQGRLQKGTLILLCGFGAGLTWGTALVRY
jgi:3-oxoacyl-[acyl-carrier-protein] synthase-3